MFTQNGREDLWGVVLSNNKKIAQWPTQEEDDDTDIDIEHTLYISNVCLGVGAKKDDINIVSVTTEDGTVSALPLAYLTASHPQCTLRLPVSPTVTFKLEQGSGPVSIAGIHERVLSDLLSEDELEDEEMEESIESPQAKSKITTKRPAQSVSLPVQKLPMKKTKVEQRSPTDSDDDDDEEDESDDEAEMKKGLSLFQNNGKDDDDDDDDDDDYEDEDDDDDDDSEEEMQESDKKEVTTKKQSPRKFQTPQQPKTKKGKSQSAKKAESTPSKRQPPAESKSASKAPKEMSLKEIKTKLQETPNLPKKREKFDNFMRNNFKINDKMTKDKLWEFAQKIKKT